LHIEHFFNSPTTPGSTLIFLTTANTAKHRGFQRAPVNRKSRPLFQPSSGLPDLPTSGLPDFTQPCEKYGPSLEILLNSAGYIFDF